LSPTPLSSYDEALQIKVLDRMRNVLKDDGVLVIGIHENLPTGVTGFDMLSDKFRIYRKSN
jgi:chemotaxis methyl-accepting protein methylase